jgi:hypothetical protein
MNARCHHSARHAGKFGVFMRGPSGQSRYRVGIDTPPSGPGTILSLLSPARAEKRIAVPKEYTTKGNNMWVGAFYCSLFFVISP